jgi:hypothetical protein
MPVGRLFSLHVAARLLDFFDDRAHWQRRLWNVGLVLGLREVLEAGEYQDAALSLSAVRDLADTVGRRALHDPGAGSELERRTLSEYLQRNLAAGGFAHRAVAEALHDIEPRYLERWRGALAGTPSPGREATARAIASHLLDAGLTPAHLHRWVSDLRNRDGEIDVEDLIEEAKTLLATPGSRHDVFVPFEIEPRIRGRRPPEWINSREAADWLRSKGHVPIQQRGGFCMSFDARSPEEAVERAADLTDRFAARVAVGVRTGLRFATQAYLDEGIALTLVRARSVEVRALEREEQVGNLAHGYRIDAALELLSHLQVAPATVAVAGGWSAIEFLLLGPGDEDGPNVRAADRLAGLVACSWPRAELTDVAWARIRDVDDEASVEWSAMETNRERALRLLEELHGNARHPGLKRGSDIAAVHRLRRLIADPRGQLNEVRGHVTESLRRLYRQRNLVLHGGQTQAVALRSAVRTAAPLVGAGFDRLVHGSLVKGQEPLELAARADFELGRLEGGDTDVLVNLLE